MSSPRPTRARHGARARCSDPSGVGCRNFARRHSQPLTCAECGGGTRAEIKHLPDGTRQHRGVIQVSPRAQALIDGTIDIEELDNEELARGYPRASDGTFRGRPPQIIPTAVHNRMRKELFERAEVQLKKDLPDAAAFMSKVIANEEVDIKTRLDAAKWLIERVMGKNPTQIQISADAPFMELLEELHRDPGPDKDFIDVDAEVVDDRF